MWWESGDLSVTHHTKGQGKSGREKDKEKSVTERSEEAYHSNRTYSDRVYPAFFSSTCSPPCATIRWLNSYLSWGSFAKVHFAKFAKACCGHQVHLSCGGAGHLHIHEILRNDTQDGKALGRGRGNAASLRRSARQKLFKYKKQTSERIRWKDSAIDTPISHLYLPRKSSHIGVPVEIMIKIDIGRLHYLLYILCLSCASCRFASLRNSCRSSSPWPDNPESCSLWERPKRFWSDIRS